MDLNNKKETVQKVMKNHSLEKENLRLKALTLHHEISYQVEDEVTIVFWTSCLSQVSGYTMSSIESNILKFLWPYQFKKQIKGK